MPSRPTDRAFDLLCLLLCAFITIMFYFFSNIMHTVLLVDKVKCDDFISLLQK